MPSTHIAQFFDACLRGDTTALAAALEQDPGLNRAGKPDARFAGWTGLHAAAAAGHAAAVRLLLDRGADPNAREEGDNTTPLHWAAAHGHLDLARALLEAGADVHGRGDLHELDVIGWATVFGLPPGEAQSMDASRRALVQLLVDRGARHHIFSALAVGDPDLVRRVVAQDPAALTRRRSRFEDGETPIHFAMRRKRADLLDLLIELGAPLDAEDLKGRTALAVAMLHGDVESAKRLHAAGARLPEPPRDGASEGTAAGAGTAAAMAALAGSVAKGVPMLAVRDIAATLDWYASIGFKELTRYEDGGVVNFGMLSFGGAELMLSLGDPTTDAPRCSLWFYTDRIEPLYQLLKARQLDAARARLAGEAADSAVGRGIQFVEDLYDPFYGGRQFSIRDPNGYTLTFLQP